MTFKKNHNLLRTDGMKVRILLYFLTFVSMSITCANVNLLEIQPGNGALTITGSIIPINVSFSYSSE